MISALVVVYNKKIEDSITFQFLKNKSEQLKIIIFDNSGKDFSEHNRSYSGKNNIIYFSLGKNVGISRAYNYVIGKIKKEKSDYIIVLDDDTNLNEHYFSEMLSEVEKGESDIILPRIKAGNIYISPAKVQFGCRIKAVKSFDGLRQDNISAINSGMIIRTTVFEKIKYNEKIFLDYVDHDFMKQIRNASYGIKIMNSTIVQNFARFQKNDVEKELIRFSIYLGDFKEYCMECHNLPFYYVSVLKYKMTQAIKYNSFSFLFARKTRK